MKEDESIKIAKASKALAVVLDMDKDGACGEVTLEPNTRAHLELARMGLQELLNSPVEKANKRLTLAREHLEIAADLFFDDAELFGADGQPTEAADNGKRPQVDRGFDEPELFERSGEVAGKIDWRIPGSSQVPADIHAGLVQALRDGAGKGKACDLVAAAASIDVLVAKDHFETLVKLGVIHKNGKGWIADLPEDHAADLSSDEDGVCATSETPEGAAAGAGW